jgi:hypothetical protein
MIKLSYLVTGTGRCGTVYMSRLLTSVGIVCGHETIFDYCGIHGARRRINQEETLRFSIVSSMGFENPDAKNIVADSSYMAAPFLDCDLLQDTKIIHVVRNPIDVINSFCNHIYYFDNLLVGWKESMVYENFIYTFLPELKIQMPQYDRAALYYIRWNQMIEKNKCDFFMRAEDNVFDLLKFLQVPENSKFYEDRKSNTFKAETTETFCFSKLQSKHIKSELLEMSKRYEYQLDGCLI